jgi:sialic acid synthase SpsE
VNSAKFLKKLNVKIFKVSSADLIDHKLHDYLSKTKKKIIISTGMATFSEIKKTLKIYKKNNTYNNVTLLHCVSNYPCSDASLNLLNIKSLYKNFSLPIGFSDHSVGFTAAPLSIALGATVIEKHVTIRNNMAGPDHKTSLNAKDFIKFVKIIKKTEKILGSLKKITQAEELPMKNISRKSLFYSKSLMKNTILKEHHIKPLRPATGILADKYFNFLGKKLVTDVKFNQKISFDHVKKK